MNCDCNVWKMMPLTQICLYTFTFNMYIILTRFKIDKIYIVDTTTSHFCIYKNTMRLLSFTPETGETFTIKKNAWQKRHTEVRNDFHLFDSRLFFMSKKKR